MTVERVTHLIGHLEGKCVSLALVDGSRLDACQLISACHHGTKTLWVYIDGGDRFVPVADVTDAWEAA